MKGKNNQPDWGQMAEKFDLWLPHIARVGDELIETLGAQPGDNILDVASGTGEPALSLARKLPNVRITGTDAADGMVKVAQAKVEQESLNNVSFRCMPAEKLGFADASFDRVLCRFGVMLFEDSLQGLREMYRVLKSGGRFALAVWSTPETMPTMHWSFMAFESKIPEAAQPPLHKVTSLGMPGALDTLLHDAGFSHFTVTKHSIDYTFESFDAYWDLVEASDVLKMQFDVLPADLHAQVRDEVFQFAEKFVQDGKLVVPHEYLIAAGIK